MRNLKRVLSLAVASVMLIGMMAVSASAANFSDVEKIVNTDAVTMVSELGIINGMPDGSFQPEANIDRASMAKMICVALNGGKDPQLGATTVSSYTDTVNNWASGYIEYCTSLGIVAGKGDKTFQPSANVTVSEAAKMLLVALGYNAETEGLVGANWQTKTDVLANQVGLYDGFISLTTSPLTRDNAAQMVYNTLNASVVKYDGGKAVAQTTMSYDWIKAPDGETWSAVSKETEKTLLADKYKVVETTGIVEANEFAAVNGVVQDEGITVISGVSYNLTTSMELLGQKVTIYARDSKTNGRTNVTGGAVPTDDCKVVVTTAKKSADDLTELIEKDNKLKTTSATVYAVNYDVTKTAITANAAGQELRIIDNNNDGKVDYMIQTTYDLGQVTTYSTKDDGSITLNKDSANLKFDAEDVVGFDDVAKNDYVLYAKIGGKLYVEKAATITGELTRIKSSSGAATDLTVDGKTYKVSGVAVYDLDKASAQTETGSDATFYMDKFGNIAAVGEIEETSASYAVVLGQAAGNDLDNGRVKVLLADGTTATYYVDEIQTYTAGKGWSEDEDATLTKGDVIAYTLDGNDITVRKNSGETLGKDTYKAADSATYTFKNGKTGIKFGDDQYYATKTTVFFYMNKAGTKGDIYVGYSKAPTPKTDATVKYRVIADEDGDAKVVVVFDAGTASNGDYLYLYNAQGANSKNSFFDAIINGELVKDIEVKGKTASVGLYEYTVDSDGVYELTTVKLGEGNYITGKVDRVSGDSVFVGGVEYLMTSDTVSALINKGKTALDEAIEEGDTVVLVNDDGDIEAIFITEEAKEEDDDETGEDDKEPAEPETVNVKVAGTVEGYTAKVSPETANKGDKNLKVTVTLTSTGEENLEAGEYTVKYDTDKTATVTLTETGKVLTFEVTVEEVTGDVTITLVSVTAPASSTPDDSQG